MLRTVLVLLAFVIISEAVHQKCMTNTDCGQNQCCNNYHGPLIMSRRRDAGSLLLNKLTLSNEGVCESYQPEGAYCSSIATMNGHCGCNIHQGLSCQFEPAPTLQLFTALKLPSIVKKSMINPAFGTYKCALLMVS